MSKKSLQDYANQLWRMGISQCDRNKRRYLLRKYKNILSNNGGIAFVVDGIEPKDQRLMVHLLVDG